MNSGILRVSRESSSIGDAGASRFAMNGGASVAGVGGITGKRTANVRVSRRGIMKKRISRKQTQYENNRN